MKKILFLTLASLYAASASAASTASDKDTAAVVKDEKVGNAEHKPLVKKATPQTKETAKEEGRKAKAQPATAESGSGSGSK